MYFLQKIEINLPQLENDKTKANKMSSITRSESMSASESMPVDANSTCVRMSSICVDNPQLCVCSRTADAENNNQCPKSMEYMASLCEEEEVVLNNFKNRIQSEARPRSARKQRIMAPPVQYDLRIADAHTVYNHINELTKHNVDSSNYLEQIKPLMFAQTKPLVFGYIPAPPNASITQQVIGLNGYFFKMTTTLCGIYYIWHDATDNTFLFWGPSTFKVVKAMNSIRWRIVKHMEAGQQQAEQQEQDQAEQQDLYVNSPLCQDDKCEYDDETDDDMPELISCGDSPDYEHSEPF